MNPDRLRDLADLEALQRGEDQALNRLIARWQKPLTTFAWRYVHQAVDARDIAAEAFVRLYQHRHRLVADTNVAAWLFTTVANLCRQRHRWRERHPTVSFEDPDNSSSAACPNPAPAELLEQREAIAALTAAIDRMPHDLKVALLLHHYDRLSYREIAQITGCSERGVETRLYRARQQLRAEMTPYLRDVAWK